MTSPGTPPAVEVRRSRRRRRTVSAYRDNGRIVVLVPERLSRAQEREWVSRMVRRLEASRAGDRPTDDELAARAAELSRTYLADRARPSSVRWVDNQRRRWGSCTPAEGTIRLSSRLKPYPSWVVDYVLLHELAHLLVPTHSPEFWALLAGYPKTERARGFLEGVDMAHGLGAADAAGSTEDGGPDGRAEESAAAGQGPGAGPSR